VDTSGPVTLQIWLPPQFDPASGTEAGQLLENHLNQFAERHPGVRLDIRIKAIDGPGGMLDAMSSASAAAPQALPDLVALPRPVLEDAALKGLLRPLDGLTTALDDSDWYEYARQLAHVQNSTFGVPFAGDALVLVYRADLVRVPPRDWSEALLSIGPLAFPAADPQALYTLALYQAAGGVVQDGQGRPDLDAEVLSQVLAFYDGGAKTNLMPSWLAQIQTDDQAWTSFQENEASMVVTWASRFMIDATSLPSTTLAAPIPTPLGSPFTLATGWLWALAGPQPHKQDLAIELIDHLAQIDFLARWTASAGYLPPRAGVLSAWPDTPARDLAGQVMLSARIYPSNDVLSALSPPLLDATVQILNQQSDPLSLAESAVEHLQNP